MEKQLDLNLLSRLPLFQDLTSEEVAQLSNLLHRKTFPVRTTLIRRSNRARWYISF